MIIIGNHFYEEASTGKWQVTNICVDKEKCEIHNQPERSKREDLDCCNKVKKLEYLHQLIINENIDCGELHRDYVDICEIFNKLIQESKMRCSEHCGNTVREAQ
jgi:hypothetical protein